jgi:group I intron endonuclease
MAKKGRKLKKKLCGVYILRSFKFPDRFYIGSSENIRKRVSTHFAHLRKNTSFHRSLQNHFNQYGENDIQPFILKLCKSNNLQEWEQFYISELNPSFNEYRFVTFPQLSKNSPYKQAVRDIVEENKKNPIQYVWTGDDNYKHISFLTQFERDIKNLCDRELFPEPIRLN